MKTLAATLGICAITAIGVYALAVAGDGGDPPKAAKTVDAVSSGYRWPPFPHSTYWSKPIPASAKTDPRSAAWSGYVREVLERNPKDAPLLAVGAYTTPIWVSRRNDPVQTIFACYRYRCPAVAGSRVRIPRGAVPDPGSDGHMVVLDPRRNVSYELFRARKQAGGWAGAGAGKAHVRRGDGAVVKGSSGPTAAHLSLLAGLIRPSEIRRGSIRHAIGVTIPGIGRGRPRCPATANVPTSSDPDAPPEGTRFQLDPAVDISRLGLPKLQRTIATALQRYGMIVNDNGGKVAFRGENFVGKRNDGWISVGIRRGTESVVLRGIPLDRLRVVEQPTC